jgi:integrase
MLGMMTWYLEVAGVKAERRRDVRGPAVADTRRMLAASSADTEAETRDAAIVAVFYCLGLRVSELCGLTLDETDLRAGTTWIRGKGRKEKELVPLPAAGGRGHPPVSAVSWHRARAVVPDPRPARGPRLNKILAHSRHRTIATLMIYVDEHDRQQTQKTLDDLVADTLTSA